MFVYYSMVDWAKSICIRGFIAYHCLTVSHINVGTIQALVKWQLTKMVFYVRMHSVPFVSAYLSKNHFRLLLYSRIRLPLDRNDTTQPMRTLPPRAVNLTVSDAPAPVSLLWIWWSQCRCRTPSALILIFSMLNRHSASFKMSRAGYVC